jgi:hypothetical protein
LATIFVCALFYGSHGPDLSQKDKFQTNFGGPDVAYGLFLCKPANGICGYRAHAAFGKFRPKFMSTIKPEQTTTILHTRLPYL